MFSILSGFTALFHLNNASSEFWPEDTDVIYIVHNNSSSALYLLWLPSVWQMHALLILLLWILCFVTAVV